MKLLKHFVLARTFLMDLPLISEGHADELKKSDQASGPISIGQLSTLLHVHLQPIYHVVSMVSLRDTLS